MKDGIKITGFIEMEKKLEALPGKLNRKLVGQSLNKAANPIAKAARSNLSALLAGGESRRSGGRQPGNLIASMKGAKIKKVKKYASGTTVVVIGASFPQGAHAHFLEMGTVKQPARPFMRPALDSQRGKALDIYGKTLAEKIEKELSK